jgi:hypothetical protein
MFKVYNKDALTRNERFQNAVVVGIGATVGLTLVYGFITSLLSLEFSVLYMLMGYVIGLVIQKAGRGVQVRFSVLAAICAFFCFFIGDMISIFGFAVLVSPSMWFDAVRIILSIWLSGLDISTLLSLAFRVLGIYFAYVYARIV